VRRLGVVRAAGGAADEVQVGGAEDGSALFVLERADPGNVTPVVPVAAISTASSSGAQWLGRLLGGVGQAAGPNFPDFALADAPGAAV